MKLTGKQLLLFTFLAVSLLTFIGCDANNVDTPTDQIIETSDIATVTTETATETTVEATETTSDEVGNALKELAFMNNGDSVAIFDKVDDQKMEAMLGKADDIKTHTYTKDDGTNMEPLMGMTEKQYFYEGLIIKTIDPPDEEIAFVFNIEITVPKYQTIRNIKVGDSYEKLIEAYPEGQLLGGELTDGEDDFRYEPVNYVDSMIFHIKDRKVESITMATLLD